MQQTITKTAELAGLIYKNMKMGADSVINLLPKVDDEAMRSRMTEQLDGYEKFAKQAREVLDAEGVEAQEEGVMATPKPINLSTTLSEISSLAAPGTRREGKISLSK